MRPYQYFRAMTRQRCNANQCSRRPIVDPILVAINNHPAPAAPEGLTAEIILRYAEEERDHFQRLHRQYFEGVDGIRIEEVRYYLNLWNRAFRWKGNWDKLPNACRNEILDRWYEETE